MKRFILVFCAVLLGSCCNRSTVSSLRSAESLISSRPDSALILLRSIDPSDLRSRKSEAKYALLMSAALDKNYIDIASDSLVRVALDYYENTRNDKYRMLAWYYEGIVLKNGQEYASAIVALEKSLWFSLRVEDPLYSGLIHRNMASLFSLTNNNEEAIRHMKEAVHYFGQAGQPSYTAFAEMSLATHLANAKEYPSALQLIHSIRELYPDPVLQDYCNLREASILVKLDTLPSKALSLFKKVPLRRFGLLDYSYYALAYEMVQEKDSSQYWIAEGYSHCKDQADSASLDYMTSRIELRRDNYKEAFQLVDHATSVQDSLTRVLLQQSVSAAQRDYYKNETLLKENRIRSMRERAIFGVVVSLLIILVLILTVITLSRKKEGLLKEQLARLAYEEKELDRLNRDNAHLIGSLFSEKINHLDKMIDSYFKMENRKQKDLAFSNIKQQVALIRSDEELFLSLEKDLDRYCNGIMAKLRHQVPEIKGENLKVITLFFAGFSYETTQFILSKSSVESLKTTRSRIRSMIRASNAPDKEVFLKMLEMKSGRRPAQMKT